MTFLIQSFPLRGTDLSGGVKRPTEDQQTRINQQVTEWRLADPDKEEEILRGLIGTVRETFTPQLYLSLAANGALESDQSFDNKQYVWSVQAALDFKDWGNKSAWSKFNFVDLPAALIRAASGYEDCGTCVRPRGTSWPTLRVGLGRVMPEDEDPRALAGDNSDFTRAEIELAYRSPIARLNEDRIYLSASWRYFREMSAIDSVKAAGIDKHMLTTVIIGGTDGVFVSFSDGKLPFAVENDQVVEVGFRWQL